MRKLRRRGWEVGTVKFVVFTEMSFVETRFEAVTCYMSGQKIKRKVKEDKVGRERYIKRRNSQYSSREEEMSLCLFVCVSV